MAYYVLQVIFHKSLTTLLHYKSKNPLNSPFRDRSYRSEQITHKGLTEALGLHMPNQLIVLDRQSGRKNLHLSKLKDQC